MAAITICSDFGAPHNKVCHCFHVSPSICHEVMGPDAMILVFWLLHFNTTFLLSSFTFIKKLLSSTSLSAIRVVSPAYLRLLIFPLAILIPACASGGYGPIFLVSSLVLGNSDYNAVTLLSPWGTGASGVRALFAHQRFWWVPKIFNVNLDF